jgi:AraC-like DNA-binding protein
MPGYPQLRFTRVPALDLELLHTRNLTHEYPSHLHEEYSIGVVLQGSETIRFSNATHVATAGAVLLINAEDVHANRSVNAEYCIMKVHADWLRRLATEVGGRDAIVRFPKPVIDDRRTFLPLMHLLQQLSETSSQLKAESAFASTFGALLTRHAGLPEQATVRKELHAVTSVRTYLKEHFAEDVSLADLRAVANLSPFYLLRLFRDHTGVPPHEYQTQLRVAHARRLIRNGETIADAALHTGFFDQSHLTRNFRRIVGLTPGQYIARSKIVQDLS